MVKPRWSWGCECELVTEGVRARLKLASAAVFGGRETSGYVEKGD